MTFNLPRLSEIAPDTAPSPNRHHGADLPAPSPTPTRPPPEWAEEDAARRAGQDRAEQDLAWPDPVPFIKPPPSTALPEAMAGTLIGDLAEMVADRWGVPPLLTATGAVGVVAAATRGAVAVAMPSGATFPLALYVMALADPGSLKSPLLAALADPLHAEQAAELDRHGSTVAVERMKAAAYGDAVKRQQAAYAKAAGTDGRLLIEAELHDLHRQQLEAERASAGVEVVAAGADLTYEALILRAADNGGRIAALSAEGSLIENLGGRYSDGQARTEFLNSAYDGEPFTRGRVGGPPVTMDRPWAALVQIVQPDVMASMLGSDHMARRGFLQRFWFLSVPPVPYRARHDLPPLDGGTMARWAAAVAAVWSRAATASTIGPGPGLAPLRTFEADLIGPAMPAAQESSPLLAGWLGKAAMTSVRVGAAMQLAESPGSGVLGLPAGQAAAGYAEVMLAHARHLFTGSRQAVGSSPRGKVLQWLTHPDTTDRTDTTPSESARTGGSVGSVGSVSGGPVLTRAVHRRFQDQAWCRTADDVRMVLTDLADLGWVQGPHKSTGPTGGRPTEQWQLHPRIREHHTAMTGHPR